jgi:prephenate dehydratase
MQNQIIAIQGIEGSNHHKVIRDFFPKNNRIKACSTFREVVSSLVKNEVNFALMAIENSIAGSILPNYRLLIDANLQITEEFYLNISHNLVALPQQRINDITQVKSHQMALHQCGNFFNKYPHIKLIEDVDTALPAKIIAKKQQLKTAALVPTGTAELFGLEVIEPNIQDVDTNETRFVLLEKNTRKDPAEVNKATLHFELKHERGSLANMLSIMRDLEMNLTKIQSIPIAHKKWNYAFIVDVRFDDLENYKKLIQVLETSTEVVKTLGLYKSGRI